MRKSHGRGNFVHRSKPRQFIHDLRSPLCLFGRALKEHLGHLSAPEQWAAFNGGETHRFRPIIDLYREAGAKAGHPPERLEVGIHSLGYVAATSKQAADDFYPGYAEVFTKIGKERGWPAVTPAHYDEQIGPKVLF